MGTDKAPKPFEKKNPSGLINPSLYFYHSHLIFEQRHAYSTNILFCFQELPIASSWICSSLAASVLKRSSFKLSWSTSTFTISNCYKHPSKGWTWTRCVFLFYALHYNMLGGNCPLLHVYSLSLLVLDSDNSCGETGQRQISGQSWFHPMV